MQHINAELRLVLTHHSTAIEGNTLTLRETMLVIEHGATIGGRTLREHWEAANHANAVQLLFDLVHRRTPITLAVVHELHQLMMDRLIDNPGQFRRGAVTIRGSTLQPPSAAQVLTLMQEWVAWLDGDGMTYPTVLRATIAHHGFLAVHPYLDGNGRTARMLLNLMLMQDGYPPALLLKEWRSGYLAALSQADAGRYNPLANLIGRAAEQGLDLYLAAAQMTSADPLDELQPLSVLARTFGYDPTYLSLLARKGRLEATKRHGRWYSTPTAIERYQDEVATGRYPRGRPLHS